MKKMTALQIAVYAVNCSNSEFYINEVAKMIEQYGEFKHGGKRKGAGRKPKEPTKTIRVKVSKLEQILKINNE